MTGNLSAALNFLSLPNACPLCIVALDPQTGRPIAVNSTFESILGPLWKFKVCSDCINFMLLNLHLN